MENKQLECVMLIDDNADDNFIHQRVIEKSGKVKRVIAEETAGDALNDLLSGSACGGIKPDLIFLDINMPGINGWEFLESYCQCPGDVNSRIIILTTSENPDDVLKASKYPCVLGFKTKPLTKSDIEELTEEFFNDEN